MRDYLEELLEELVEETEEWELLQSASLTAPSRREPEERRDLKAAGVQWTHEGMGPYVRARRGAAETGDGEVRSVREAADYEEKKGRNSPVSFADSPLTKGAKGVEVLWSRLRRGAMAAAYRANTPAVPEIPERGYVREKSLLELDAAVRRDARRYDGEMTLY